MRLIIEYTISDDCTYSFNVVEPIIYESKELARIDFGSKLLEISEQKKSYLKSCDIWLNQFNSISATNSEKNLRPCRHALLILSKVLNLVGKNLKFIILLPQTLVNQIA